MLSGTPEARCVGPIKLRLAPQDLAEVEVADGGAFAKAIELGSIRKAALAQGVTPQAASHAVAQLEQRLGVRLLHRTTRSLAPTDEGRHLLEQALPALAALEGALMQVKEARHAIAGPIRISGPKSSFAPVLMPPAPSAAASAAPAP